MRVDVARERAAHAPHRARAAGADAAAAARAAPARRRALRPAQGAARRRALPRHSPSERFGREDLAVVSYHMGMGNLENVLAAYGERDASWAQRLLRRHAATATRARYRLLVAASATTPPPTCGASTPRGRSCACTARTPRSSRRAGALQTAKALGRGGAAPARADEGLRGARRSSRTPTAAGELRPFRTASAGLRRDPQMGELARRLDARPLRSTAGCARRPTRWRSTWPRACARWRARGRRCRDQHGARPALPAPARARQPVGHARVLAAHHRLRVRRPARLRERPPGGGLPVHARPPAVAQPDRVGARAGRDPHHRLERGGRLVQ